MKSGAPSSGVTPGGILHRSLVALGPLLWSACGLVLTWMAITGVRMSDKPLWDEVSLFLVFGAFVSVGSVLTWRQPRNVVGWLLAGVGGGGGALFIATAYASVALQRDPASVSGWFAAWWGEASWLPVISLVVVFLPLTFPEGRLLGRRWRLVVLVALVGLGVGSFAVAIAPTTYVGETGFGFAVPNRLGSSVLPASLLGVLEGVGGATVVFTGALANISLVLRFRRADPATRRQISWVLYAVTASLVIGGVADLFPRPLASAVVALTLAAVPVSILIAVTRYHLYDIDRLVNRTVVYGTTTAALLALYAAAVVTLQPVVRPWTGSSDLAIAASTLAVAAAFGPLRRRIQLVVDRRFDRARYDAQLTVAAFTDRLRRSLDIDEFEVELREVIAVTLQAEHTWMWLRTGPRRPGPTPGP